MLTPEQTLNIAQTLQPQLRDRLPADIAADIDQQLTALIAKANAGEPVAQDIFNLLNSQAALKPELTAAANAKHFSPLAGNSAPRPQALEYECPECHETYAALPQGRTPQCPNHPEQTLIRTQG